MCGCRSRGAPSWRSEPTPRPTPFLEIRATKTASVSVRNGLRWSRSCPADRHWCGWSSIMSGKRPPASAGLERSDDAVACRALGANVETDHIDYGAVLLLGVPDIVCATLSW